MRWWKITWWVGGGGEFKCSGKASLRFYIWAKNLNHKKLLSLWRSGRRLSKQKEQQGQLPSVRNELGTYKNQKQGQCAWSLRTGGRCGSRRGWRGRQGFQIVKGLVDHGNNWDVILSTVGSPGGLYTEDPCDVKGYHLAVIRRVDCGEQNGNGRPVGGLLPWLP